MAVRRSCFLSLSSLLVVTATSRPAQDSRDPSAKRIIRSMDALISNHVAWDNWTAWSKAMELFWTSDFTYDTVEGFPDGGNFTGLRGWYEGEHIPFNTAFWPVDFTQMIFLAENHAAATTTYANAIWTDRLGPLKPGHKQDGHVVIRICDFYRVVDDKSSAAGGRIAYNWMMIDMVGLLLQAGQRVLPKPNLPEGLWVQPPLSLDGLPAPNSFFVRHEVTQASRTVTDAMLQHEWLAHVGVAPQWAEDMTWYGPVGIGVARSKQEYRKEFIEKLFGAFKRIEIQLDVVACEGHFCGAHGYLHGDHIGEWLGQAATGKRVSLRFGSHWHVVDGKIIEGWTIMDLPALFKQFGVNLFNRTSRLASEPQQVTLFE